MSKTVLLPDDLYDEIQKTDIEIYWVLIEHSMAKKIKLFFDLYKFNKMVDEWTETLESFKRNNSVIWNDLQDEKIRADKNWKNPWLITWKSTDDVTI